MGKILWYDNKFFQFLFNYNYLQWCFVCVFQCTSVGLLLSDKGSTWFPEFTFDVFDPYSQSAILCSSFNIAWDFTCLF